MANRTTGGPGTDDRDDVGTGHRGDLGKGTGNVGGVGRGSGEPGELDRDRGMDRDLDEDIDPPIGDRGGMRDRGRNR